MAEAVSHQLKHKKVLPYVLCIEGNIGSGKSTLLSKLSKCGFTVIEEPVNDIWGKYLPRLYEDLKRWGFCFQMEAMDWFRQLQSKKFEHLLIKMKENKNIELNKTEIESKEEEESSDDEDEDYDIDNDQENMGDIRNSKEIKSNKQISPKKQLLSCLESKKLIIVERSALSAITIFAANLLDTGFMGKWEYSLLERFYSMIAWEPGHILYLRVNPEICCQRIQKRNRDGEGKVNPKLIKNLHNKHENMFNINIDDERKVNHMISSQNVIVVDGHKNSDSVLQEALQKILSLESNI